MLRLLSRALVDFLPRYLLDGGAGGGELDLDEDDDDDDDERDVDDLDDDVDEMLEERCGVRDARLPLATPSSLSDDDVRF